MESVDRSEKTKMSKSPHSPQKRPCVSPSPVCRANILHTLCPTRGFINFGCGLIS